MASREFDLLWFFAPLLLAFAASILLQLPAAASPSLLFLFIVNAFGIGPMHQGPTWFFYFDKKNSQYWAQDPKRLALYYVAPVLVGIVTVFLAVTTPWLGVTITTLGALVQQNLACSFSITTKTLMRLCPIAICYHAVCGHRYILHLSVLLSAAFPGGENF
jgi:succinate dehydrogenase hydrophobic anchor subunit